MTQKPEDDYLKFSYTVLVREAADGSFFAEIAEFPGCWAEGKSEKEAREILEEAKYLWIKTQLADNQPIPEPREGALQHLKIHGSNVGVWTTFSSIANETNQRVFSDLIWTYNMADRAVDFMEYPTQAQTSR